MSDHDLTHIFLENARARNPNEILKTVKLTLLSSILAQGTRFQKPLWVELLYYYIIIAILFIEWEKNKLLFSYFLSIDFNGKTSLL